MCDDQINNNCESFDNDHLMFAREQVVFIMIESNRANQIVYYRQVGSKKRIFGNMKREIGKRVYDQMLVLKNEAKDCISNHKGRVFFKCHLDQHM